MKLISIELQNFKGIKNQIINTGGENITIRGANGSGKTTIFDAWLWLLFGKDSTGRSSFEVKTLDSNGYPLHGLDHVVEAAIDNGGTEIILRKEYREKWTKKRGESAENLTGHETSCYVDGVPVKISDYAAYISDLVNEDLFKLLSDPAQFQRLDWKKRRELMLSLINSDDDILSDPVFDSIKELVEKHGTDDAMTLLKDRRKKLNDQIKQIPVRIDEASRSASESPQTFDVEKAKKLLDELLKERASYEQNAKDAAKKRIDEQAKTLEIIQHHKNQIKEYERIAADSAAETMTTIRKIDEVNKSIASLKTYIEGFDKSQDQIRTMIKDLESSRAEVVTEWKTRKAEALDAAMVDTACPTCGQNLPADKGEEMIDKARDKFEAAKERDLGDIVKRGAALKNTIEKHNLELASGEEKLSQARAEIIELMGKKAEFEKALQVPAIDYSVQIKQTTELIEQLNEKLQVRIDFKIAGTDGLDAEIAKVQRQIANQDAVEAAQRRINELTAEGKKLSVELVATDGQIIALEEYIKAKVETVEAELNKLFESVTFKLFDQQLNGGINETFVTLIEGVPFADANTASQINAGLEIIEHLSDHYSVRTVVFVDHKESVSRLVPINSQIINLMVDENYRELKIEMEG